MDFSKRRAQPHKHLLAVACVIFVHAVVVYALLTGLGTKLVEVIRSPVEVRIVAEPRPAAPVQPAVAAPPPPRPKAPPPPPPPVVPPPEMAIAAPPPVLPAITAPAAAPPAQPVPESLAAAPAAAPAPPPAQAAQASAADICPNHATAMGDAAYPREALRQGIYQGEALIEFTVGPHGEIRDMKSLRASHPIFARSSIRIVSSFRCRGQVQDVTLTVPFGYRFDQ